MIQVKFLKAWHGYKPGEVGIVEDRLARLLEREDIAMRIAIIDISGMEMH